MTYEVVLSPRARRALSEELPEAVAAACIEFITGPLAENPRRVGKPLRNELAGTYSARRGEFRVVYDIDDNRICVEVISIRHRRDAYRTREVVGS
ncbi:type II toxin-antitoxin system RelE/ParE family toxin [Mycobacterium sp. TNTM28]|uniref:Type II toxin-antitoxin system RelE/ParE family toxin n=1 Tax=[Mycobacterium] fortunisiensis TaxID=2600579 RepID=A0ABS6KRU3_9MYCO|nr:type II toxin-antitoxin system RelE/ParE family toxin [[Mycobacterium] fortunisiensis]MBU9766362.1 type II toxin-antitoxin system RelE/ParE family toxin [[Mycobacterium] fortunisiensis]